MSRERKLKRYAEGRLSSYAGAEDSLARLKREQSAISPQKEKKGFYKSAAFKAALSFCVVLLVVGGVFSALYFSSLPMGKDSAIELSQVQSAGENDAVPNAAPGGASSADGYTQEKNVSDSSSIAYYTLKDVNVETECLNVVLPSGAAGQNNGEASPNGVSVLKESGAEWQTYRFSFSAGGVEVRAIVAFGNYEPQETVLTDRETTIGGETFLYGTDGGVLSGKITTACETIYITHCSGGSESACLSVLRSIFIEK